MSTPIILIIRAGFTVPKPAIAVNPIFTVNTCFFFVLFRKIGHAAILGFETGAYDLQKCAKNRVLCVIEGLY